MTLLPVAQRKVSSQAGRIYTASGGESRWQRSYMYVFFQYGRRNHMGTPFAYSLGFMPRKYTLARRWTAANELGRSREFRRLEVLKGKHAHRTRGLSCNYLINRSMRIPLLSRVHVTEMSYWNEIGGLWGNSGECKLVPQ